MAPKAKTSKGKASAKGASAKGASAKGASAKGASAKGASAKGASAKGASAKGASAKGASAKGASAKGASAKGASAKGASAKGASAKGPTKLTASAVRKIQSEAKTTKASSTKDAAEKTTSCFAPKLDLMAGFVLFCRHERDRDDSLADLSSDARLDELSARWRALTKYMREEYARLAAKDMNPLGFHKAGPKVPEPKGKQQSKEASGKADPGSPPTTSLAKGHKK